MPKLVRSPWTIRPVLALALGLVLALGLSALPAQAGGGAKPAEKPEALPLDDGAAQKATVADLRNVGTALFSWLTDQVDTVPEKSAGPECGPTAGLTKESGNKLLDVVNVPEISWEDLRKILVPQYIQELPRNDRWGNPYEYRLNLENLYCPQVMALRSAGSDGRFDTNGLYDVGSFDPEVTGEDLVWADGFFVRWPQRPVPAKEPVKR